MGYRDVLVHLLENFEVSISKGVMKEKTTSLGSSMGDSDNVDNGDMLAERSGNLEDCVKF